MISSIHEVNLDWTIILASAMSECWVWYHGRMTSARSVAILAISAAIGGSILSPLSGSAGVADGGSPTGAFAAVEALGEASVTIAPPLSSRPDSAISRDHLWRSIAGHPAPAPEVLRAIMIAAGRAELDLGLLLAAAWKESSFRPSAAAPNSSARGLFQFTQATWREALANHGGRLGVPSGAGNSDQLRFDPSVASLVAAETIRRNGEILASRLGRPITQAEAFLTHFLGLSGAERFLRAVRETPSRDVRQIIPTAFANNRARFPSGTGAIPVASAYTHLIAILESRRNLYLQLLRLEYLTDGAVASHSEVALDAR